MRNFLNLLRNKYLYLCSLIVSSAYSYGDLVPKISSNDDASKPLFSRLIDVFFNDLFPFLTAFISILLIYSTIAGVIAGNKTSQETKDDNKALKSAIVGAVIKLVVCLILVSTAIYIDGQGKDIGN